MTNHDRDTPVLIAGGGPVGMTLALALARHGVRSMLVERNPTTTSHPKMDITNARSMELFERVGAAAAIRSVSTSPLAPFDVSWITTLSGQQLHRFNYPGAAEASRQWRAANDGRHPLTPAVRASQILVEPALKGLIDASPLVDVRFAVALEGLQADEAGVTAHLRRLHDGAPEAVTCAYLVGCDGGGSTVREHLNIGLNGQARMGERAIVHFRSDERALLQRWGAAWHYQSNLGTLVAQNDWDTWTLLARLPAGMTAAQANPSDLLARFAGRPLAHRVQVSNAWSPNLLVADHYRRGRVFLAGDAAHQYIPTGGYGMNTGIGDAVDLGWKLAAILKGFGGPALLDAYEQERRPVGLRNVAASGRHNAVRIQIAGLYNDPGLATEDAAVLQRIGRQIADIGNAENESFGIEYGYSYAGSPIIQPEAGAAIPQDPIHYEPTTLPGVRLPDLLLETGERVYDQLGPWYSLIHFGRPEAAQAMAASASRLHLPLTLVDLGGSTHAASLYAAGLLLVRPDTQIAWRGQSAANSDSILAMAAGHTQ